MLNPRMFSFLAACLALVCSCKPSNGKHVTIYTAKKIISISTVNDSVYTNNPAVAVDDSGRIAGVGDLASLQKRFDQNTVKNDFANEVIMPGLVEAHSHFQPNGMFAKLPYTGYYTRPGIDDSLYGIKSDSAMVRYLKAKLDEHPRHPLLANGADPIYFNGSRFTSATLDAVSKTVPILMQLGSGHIVICNTPMLDILKKTKGWHELPEKTVVKKNGLPTGELDESEGVEFAFKRFNEIYKDSTGTSFFTLARMSKAITDGATLMTRAGVTTATDLLFTGASKIEFIANRLIYNDMLLQPKKFPVRVVLAYDGYALSKLWGHSWWDSSITFLRSQQLLDNNSLRTGLVKFVLDGSIQGYTAQVSKPYLNPPGNPIWNVPPKDLATLMSPFIQNGFPVAIHTNGDRAIDTAIAALQSIQSKNKVKGSIWATLEHAQMITPAHFDMLTKMNGVATNLFVSHIWYYGREHALYTIGPDWVKHMGNVKAADDLKIPYSIHSDAPVTPALPLFSAWVASNRITAPDPVGQYSNEVFGTPISLRAALRAITISAAQLLNMDNEIGSIDEGKWADFAILGADPLLTNSGLLLKDIPVKGTMKAGVYFDAKGKK